MVLDAHQTSAVHKDNWKPKKPMLVFDGEATTWNAYATCWIIFCLIGGARKHPELMGELVSSVTACCALMFIFKETFDPLKTQKGGDIKVAAEALGSAAPTSEVCGQKLYEFGEQFKKHKLNPDTIRYKSNLLNVFGFDEKQAKWFIEGARAALEMEKKAEQLREKELRAVRRADEAAAVHISKKRTKRRARAWSKHVIKCIEKNPDAKITQDEFEWSSADSSSSEVEEWSPRLAKKWLEVRGIARPSQQKKNKNAGASSSSTSGATSSTTTVTGGAALGGYATTSPKAAGIAPPQAA
ncbi:unnamed protein product [Amoebophrya sp. A25]|nr:unnamed protein product [Amoebophrya sp. A25]|eukprot:GSA25T00019923001.1